MEKLKIERNSVLSSKYFCLFSAFSVFFRLLIQKVFVPLQGPCLSLRAYGGQLHWTCQGTSHARGHMPGDRF